MLEGTGGKLVEAEDDVMFMDWSGVEGTRLVVVLGLESWGGSEWS